jgi:hypothetical protein
MIALGLIPKTDSKKEEKDKFVVWGNTFHTLEDFKNSRDG